MGSIRQIIGTAVVTVALLAVGVPSAFATGTLRVGINGAGEVTGSGIDCTRAIGDSAPSGDCGSRYTDCPIISRLCTDPTPVVTLVAGNPGTGFVFDGWSGACASQLGAKCTLKIDSDYATTANFADNTDPTVTLGTVASLLHGTVTLTATASDNAAVDHVDFSIGGKTVSDSSAPYSVDIDTTAVADGAGTAVATAVDSSHRSSAASAPVTIDNTPPALTVGGPNGATFAAGTTQTWTISAADKGTGLASVACSVVPAGADASFGKCTGGNLSETVANKPGGAYVMTVRATDAAGNHTDASRPFVIDATPPVTSVTSGVGDGASTSETSLTWGLAASEPGVTFVCRVYPAALTPGAFAPCSSPSSHTASGFAPGVYTFEVRATDAVGNVETVPVKRTFTITPPPPTAAAAIVLTSPQLQSAKHAPEPPILVTLAFSFANSTKTHTRLTSLVVKGVPRGATVTAVCPKHCAAKSFKKTAAASGKVSLAPLIRKPLKVGSTIRVTVSRAGFTSTIKTLTIRPHKAPLVTTRCQPEGASHPSSC